MSPHTGEDRGWLISLLVLSLHLGQAQCGVSVGAAAGGAAHVLLGGGGGGGEPRERDEDTEALVIFMMAAAAIGMRKGYNVENNRNCLQPLYQSVCIVQGRRKFTKFILSLHFICQLVWLYSATVSSSWSGDMSSR